MLTIEQEHLVLQEYRRVRSPFKVARNLELDVTDVWTVIDANPDAATANVERWGGEGRPDLRRYIVARVRSCDRWDNDDPAIARARANYEAGTHDMCQHRDGSWKFLLSIPHRWPVSPRVDYFKPEVQF